MATIEDITKRAAEIRDNYKPNSNTAELVGGVMVDLAGNLKTFEEEEAAKVEAAADAKVEERLADITNLQTLTSTLSKKEAEDSVQLDGFNYLVSGNHYEKTRFSAVSSIKSFCNYAFKKGKKYIVTLHTDSTFHTDNDINLYTEIDTPTSLGVVKKKFNSNFVDCKFTFSFVAVGDANYLGTWFDPQDAGNVLYCDVKEDYLNEDLDSIKSNISDLTKQVNKQYEFTHTLGNPFTSQQECLVDFDFKKGNTYVMNVKTTAKLYPIYSILDKDTSTLLDENITTTKPSSTEIEEFTFAYKPSKDCIGLGCWCDNSEYNKEVYVTITEHTNEEPTYVIVDADICGDIDDLMAMRVLSQAEKQGKIIFVGMNVCQPNENSATGIDGFMCHEGINDLCVGIDSTVSTSRSLYLDKCALHYHTYTANSECEDTLDFYKRALNFIPDNSKAILLTLGFFTSLKRVIENDELKALFAKKINKVYSVGGDFINTSYIEYNFSKDVEATRYFANNCPVPIYFVGAETSLNVMGGKVLGEKGYTWDLLQIAFLGFYREWGYTIETPMERNAPDPVTAMIAIADDPSKYNLVYVRGKVLINDNGTCSFSQTPTSNRHYVVWHNNTTDYPYEKWISTMEMKLSHIIARDNEGDVTNVRRLNRL